MGGKVERWVAMLRDGWLNKEMGGSVKKEMGGLVEIDDWLGGEIWVAGTG
jgi:hypothetical protein